MNIPPTVGGCILLVSILQARQLGLTKFAQPGAPAQYDIEALLKATQKRLDDNEVSSVEILNIVNKTKGIDL